MMLELIVSKVVEAAYVDLNDFDGFRNRGMRKGGFFHLSSLRKGH